MERIFKMKHKQKVKIARKISGKSTNHFTSAEWTDRSKKIAKKVFLIEKRQQFISKNREEAENVNQITK